jgi:hypothetical protein
MADYKKKKYELDTEKAARTLQISVATMRKLAREDLVPHLRISERCWRFNREELLESVKRGPKIDRKKEKSRARHASLEQKLRA